MIKDSSVAEKKRVLIVEDNADDQLLFARGLHHYLPEAETITAATLDEAKRVIADKTRPLHGIISDNRFPENNNKPVNELAAEVIKHAALHRPGIPVFVHSDSLTNEQKREFLELGASGVHEKTRFLEKTIPLLRKKMFE